MLQMISVLAWIAVAILAGLGKFSFWWVLIPAFFAGAFGLSNGPHYSTVVEANRRGNAWLFPMQLAIYTGGNIFGAGIAYWITRWLT